MADISKCMNGEICAVSKNCYRHTATSSLHWQSYSDFQPNGAACEYYWPNDTKVLKVLKNQSGAYEKVNLVK